MYVFTALRAETIKTIKTPITTTNNHKTIFISIPC